MIWIFKKQHAIGLLALPFFLAGCTPFVRMSTTERFQPRNAENCSIEIAGPGRAISRPTRRIGEISVGDTGLSTGCDAQSVINLIREKACSIGADAVSIYQERMPDLLSTCYRAKARLLKYSNGPRDESITVVPTSTPSLSVDTPTYKKPQNETNVAVIVGIEKYRNAPEADFAENDARAMRRHLQALGYPDRNIVFLTGQDATKAKIEAYLKEWLPKNVTADSAVFFYFSGHGAPDTDGNQAFLLPSDGDPMFLKTTAYPLNSLLASLEQLPAKQIVVALDSCFSGAGGRSVVAKGTRPLVGKVNVAFNSSRMTVLTAGTDSEIAGVLSERSHGLFTYFLLQGISELASKGDAAITSEALLSFAKPYIQDEARRQNRQQTPSLRGNGMLKWH